MVFEFNLFIKNASKEFPGENKYNFKFGGYNKGENIMVAGNILKNPIQRFNNQRYFTDNQFEIGKKSPFGFLDFQKKFKSNFISKNYKSIFNRNRIQKVKQSQDQDDIYF